MEAHLLHRPVGWFTSILALAAVFVLAASGATSSAATYLPDPGFANAGFDERHLTGDLDRGAAVAVQADGKLLVAGTSLRGDFVGMAFSAHEYEAAIARYLPNGTLDPSFGNAGIAVSGNIPGWHTYDMAIQPDGRIVLTGSSLAGDVMLLRFHANGAIDTSFGGDGSVTHSIGAADSVATSVHALADGRIVATGHSYSGSRWQLTAIRLLADGSLDPSFNTTGVATADVGADKSTARDGALLPDGSVLVMGEAYSAAGPLYEVGVVRFTANGALDPGFGTGGKQVITIPNSHASPVGMAVRPDGRIIVVGHSFDGTYHGMVVQLTGNGALDTSFSGDGIHSLHLGGTQTNLIAVVPLGDAGMVVGGHFSDGTTARGTLAAIDANGDFDPSFGDAGIVMAPWGVPAMLNDIAVDASSSVIAATGTRSTPIMSTILTAYVVLDRCDNIVGIQRSIPAGMVIGGSGACEQQQQTTTTEPVDACPNLAGNQQQVPSNMRVASNGRCVGLDRNLRFVGGSGMDVFEARRGNDVLYGLGGNDRLFGGAGNDRIFGGERHDWLFGGLGNDFLSGGPGRDKLNGGPGNDWLVGGRGGDRLVGGPGRDVLVGGPGNDLLLARDGRRREIVNCGPGKDTAVVDRGDIVIGCERVLRR